MGYDTSSFQGLDEELFGFLHRPVMDVSESKAMRRRLEWEVEQRHRKFEDWLTRNRMLGQQLTGKRLERFAKAFEHYMEPLLLGIGGKEAGINLKKRRQWVVLRHNPRAQLQPQVVTIDKNGMSRRTSKLVFSQHAIERLIQYLRVRRFDDADVGLLLCLCLIITTVIPSNLTGKVPILDAGCKLLGEVAVVGDTDTENLVITTFIGARSISQNRLDQYRESGLEIRDVFG